MSGGGARTGGREGGRKLGYLLLARASCQMATPMDKLREDVESTAVYRVGGGRGGRVGGPTGV